MMLVFLREQKRLVDTLSRLIGYLHYEIIDLDSIVLLSLDTYLCGLVKHVRTILHVHNSV